MTPETKAQIKAELDRKYQELVKLAGPAETKFVRDWTEAMILARMVESRFLVSSGDPLLPWEEIAYLVTLMIDRLIDVELDANRRAVRHGGGNGQAVV